MKFTRKKRRCLHCNRVRAEQEYYQNKRTKPDGDYYFDLRPECKECTKAKNRIIYNRTKRKKKAA